MADYYSGRIKIGGELNVLREIYSGFINGLVKYIKDNGLYLTKDNGLYLTEVLEDKEDLIRHLGECNGGHFTVHGDDLRWGEFEWLEEKCRGLGLSYNRFTAQDYEGGPYISYWRPGMDNADTVNANYDAEISIPLDVIKRELKKGVKALRKAIKDWDIPELPVFVYKG